MFKYGLASSFVTRFLAWLTKATNLPSALKPGVKEPPAPAMSLLSAVEVARKSAARFAPQSGHPRSKDTASVMDFEEFTRFPIPQSRRSYVVVVSQVGFFSRKSYGKVQPQKGRLFNT